MFALRDSQGFRCPRSFWTDINRLEPRVQEKQDGDQVVVSGELIIREFQLFFSLFSKLLDNIFVSIKDFYLYILFAQVKGGREGSLTVVLWSLFTWFTSRDLLPSVFFFVVIWRLGTNSCTRERFNRIVGTTRDAFHGKVSKLCHKLSLSRRRCES